MNVSLNSRVTLQSRTITQDDKGQQQEAWANVETVWARRVDLGGVAFFDSDKPNEEARSEFTIRWRSDVNNLNRVVDGTENFDVKPPVKALGRQQYLTLVGVAPQP